MNKFLITLFKIAVWFILFSYFATIAFELLTASNTLANIIGYFILLLISIISVKTNLFTIIKFKRKK